MKSADQKRVLVEVVQRVLQEKTRDPGSVEALIFDTLYEERRRLETEKDRKKAAVESKFYRKLQSRALRGGAEQQREVLAEILRHFAEEVLGHFSETIYRIATQIVPFGLNLLLNTLSPLRLLTHFPNGVGKLDDQILLEGHKEDFQKLAALGTTILVPTHCSNLDSLLIGYVLHRLGLPPFLYGAGLNLFHNRLIGFFMDHLGAYKVDRRKKAPLYKDVLKAYAGFSMELGYHNLFFPGGTRSRSGEVERRLKLGLMGMGLDAYIHNLKNGKANPDIFIVPCTLNYQLVLEAETLIEDYLREVGRSRYIIEDDEFSQIKRIIEFLEGLFSLESRIHVVFSQPLDVFGNPVDGEGRSLDRRGREVDRRKYVTQDGEIRFDPQRDQEYTLELGESILRSFRRDTVIGSVQVVSHVVWAWLRSGNPGIDLYRLIRTGGGQASLPLTEAYRRLQAALKFLRGMEKRDSLRLDKTPQESDPVAVLSEALDHLKSYHKHPVLERKGDRLFHFDRQLIYYYQNRLSFVEMPS
ncbi:MAG: 1-acyl-sn-glycerol-3-phosphate acyltransferase [Deltaproteobacteria bacterium]|nr:1-acyl-sn-glycerol-3-phosphate acyltransferase [Deltaproteobacteria bacterium]